MPPRILMADRFATKLLNVNTDRIAKPLRHSLRQPGITSDAHRQLGRVSALLVGEPSLQGRAVDCLCIDMTHGPKDHARA